MGLVRVLSVSAIAVAVLAGCSSASLDDCPKSPHADLAGTTVDDASLPFRFPLDEIETHSREATFCEPSRPFPPDKFHAAEDYHRPAGTPVYAMADGEVSFSGPMGGYGWLIIIDHPEMNIYSLYGHLSPSRWRMDSGTVAKGDLIAYLGDEWENGGSRDEPLVAHLHFGLRAGQRSDYPAKGEWRWMAGWISLCPRDLGWLQPSAVMAGQTFPSGGFEGPVGGFLEKWWIDLMILGGLVAGGLWWLGIGIKRDQPLIPIVAGVVLGGATWYLRVRGISLITPVFVLAAGVFVAGLWMVVRRLANRND